MLPHQSVYKKARRHTDACFSFSEARLVKKPEVLSTCAAALLHKASFVPWSISVLDSARGDDPAYREKGFEVRILKKYSLQIKNVTNKNQIKKLTFFDTGSGRCN